MKKPLLLPALRGSFGSWTYYSSLVSAPDLANRVQYAKEIHASKELSDFIQRELEGARAKKIRSYLKKTDRFFSSLVLAIYGGQPEWIEIDQVRSLAAPKLIKEIKARGTVHTLGFLRLSGSEKIFALDGQHRLAGVKLAQEACIDLADDSIPVIFVGHAQTPAGMRRTRRLFTTLNKTAVAVKKSEIIALDEDDVMAITVRRMIEDEGSPLRPPRIAVTKTQNLPAGNREALTTIGSLYDCLKLLFRYTSEMKPEDLRFNRPEDSVLDLRYKEAMEFISALRSTFSALDQYLSSAKPSNILEKYRNAAGGHVLFRPLGLDIITRVVVEQAKKDKGTIRAAVRKIGRIPVDLNRPPYAGIIWNPQTKRIVNRERSLAVDLLLWMLNLYDQPKLELLARYRRVMEDAHAALPDKV